MTTNNKKYIIRKEKSAIIDGATVYRIEAARSFGDVTKGDIGGFVQTGYNLSHDGNCWVYDEAKIDGHARVFDNAQIRDDVMIYGYAKVFGNARIYDKSLACGHARVFGNALVTGNARVYGKAQVFGNSSINGNSWIRDKTCVYGHAVITNSSCYRNTWIYGPNPEVDYFPSPTYYKKKL